MLKKAYNIKKLFITVIATCQDLLLEEIHTEKKWQLKLTLKTWSKMLSKKNFETEQLS